MLLSPLQRVASRCAYFVSDAWYALRVYCYAMDIALWLVGGAVLAVVIGLGFMIRSVSMHAQERHDLTCLALNVYFEARGEPRAGQYAVAEVTMNRVASPYYPKTICGVVFQKNWDPLRKRYVGEFSWTEIEANPAPHGLAWREAWHVAKAVYYHHYTPTAPILREALNYHATYVHPSWARGRKPIAHIGHHLFYD